MSKNNRGSIAMNILKGIAALVGGAVLGRIVGDKHSDVNEIERKKRTDQIERNMNN